MGLKEVQLDRYKRNILLEGVGEEGQKRLLDSRVLVIGAGGLGSPVLMYLAAAGVGCIGVADADVVDVTNLQRQVMHREKLLGTPKVDSAKKSIEALNKDVSVKTYNIFITENNILEIIRDYDFVIDATDNFESKFLINDACVKARKPFSHGAVREYGGQLMTYVPDMGPCYRCVFNSPPPDGAVPESSSLGVLGAVCGVIGSMQASEALKYILGVGELLVGKMLIYDSLSQETRIVKLPKKNPNCGACGDR